jgi:hypothetical protein
MKTRTETPTETPAETRPKTDGDGTRTGTKTLRDERLRRCREPCERSVEETLELGRVVQDFPQAAPKNWSCHPAS